MACHGGCGCGDSYSSDDDNDDDHEWKYLFETKIFRSRIVEKTIFRKFTASVFSSEGHGLEWKCQVCCFNRRHFNTL